VFRILRKLSKTLDYLCAFSFRKAFEDIVATFGLEGLAIGERFVGGEFRNIYKLMPNFLSFSKDS
jgi:hypothetical protein